MKMKYKKLVVAIQSATMTSLICSALPSHASDIELYKAPQTSQTTLMFMLDISGSMNPSSNDYSENRLQSVKDGMTILLKGGTVNGKVLSPLEDKVAVGLSTFNNTTGRINLEARKLSELVTSEKINKIITKTTTIEKNTVFIESQECKNDCKKNDPDWRDSTYSVNNADVKVSVIAQQCFNWDEISLNCLTWDNTSSFTNPFNSTPVIPSNLQFENKTGGWEIVYDGKTAVKRTRTRILKQTASSVQEQNENINFQEVHRNKLLRTVLNLSARNGTPTAAAYAEVASYMLGTTTKDKSGSGFLESSVTDSIIRNANTYTKPATIDNTKQCNTQGIYFLTDGVPEYSNNYSASQISASSISPVSFACDSTVLGQRTTKVGSNIVNYYDGDTSRDNWKCIGSLAKKLVDADNPEKVSILTAVVGFGSDMSGSFPSNMGAEEKAKRANDIQDAKSWGALGQGGFYNGNNSEAVVTSVNKFLKILEKYIPPVTTGSVTIPVDNLDTQNIQKWGYFPQFDPQPSSTVVSWVGNVKKYQNMNSVLVDRNNKNIMTDKGISVDDPYDFWADPNVVKVIVKKVDNVDTNITVKVGGLLSRLKQGITAGNFNERVIFTDREKINVIGNESKAVNKEKGDLVRLNSIDLYNRNTSNDFVYDTKRGYLAALFGFDVSRNLASSLTVNATDSNHTNFKNFMAISTNAKLRQMGAVMHSKPVLITQSGTTTYDEKTGDLTYTDRDDLIVFGDTSGLLHVVKAGDNETGYGNGAGEEVLVFAPSELIDKQYEGFINNNEQAGSLQYGVDGSWTAYTEYVTKSGTKATEPVVTVKGGKQWLYGGLRMGGESYYALDLSNVTSNGGTPKLKFRIDPKSARAYSPLSYMGQSWSKPTLTWVNWKGERKLVMIVGGGYDNVAYESNINYSPSSSIDKGAGVYMFDADNGSLLWWSSANVSSSSKLNTETYAANMKRSVVSQIKAVDRNNDGLADHLYFGDLGGQVWRVDINASNKAGDTENFAKRAVRILDMSSAANVPRFYTTPTFTVHSSVNGYFGVVTIGSGNLSFPMSAANQNDALYVIYDKDVAKRNLSVLEDSELSTVDISPSGLNGKKLVANSDGNTEVPLTSGGWYYPLASKNRILNDNVAIDSDLYISVFDSTIDIDDVDCVGGVRGKSVAKQFCLPFGQCLKKDSSGNNVSDNRPEDIELGRGNIGISFGGIDKKRGLVLNLPTDKTLKSYQGKTKFISQRWYER